MSVFWMNFWVSVVAGIISGLISGWIVSKVFYRRSIKGQRRDMALLRNLHRIEIQALEDAKFIEVSRDLHGDPIGIVSRVQAGTGVVFSTGSTGETAVGPRVADSGRVRLGPTASVEVVHPPVSPAENPG